MLDLLTLGTGVRSGYYNPQTASDWPDGVSMAQNGMLIYNHTSRSLRNETTRGYGDNEGFWHGTLQHLPIGCGRGMLLSLMAEKGTLGEPLPFVDGTGVGTPVYMCPSAPILQPRVWLINAV